MKMLNKHNRLFLYIAVGIVWLFLWILYSALNDPERFASLAVNETWRVLFLVLANFFIFEYLLSLAFQKKLNILVRVAAITVLTVVILLVISFGLYLWIKWGMTLNIYTQFRFVNLIPDSPFNRFMEGVSHEAKSGIASVLLFGLAKLLHHNFRLGQAAQQLRIEKKDAELSYLKAQMNPHFLFNTLNNIYSLARVKSDHTADSILRLSKILRFILHETNDEFITIEKELELLSNYIELERLRYDDSLQLNFDHDIEDKAQLLPPLLMIPLIENAFKHVSETSENAFIDINLSIDKRLLELNIENSAETTDAQQPIKENIGLTNLRRQLELLYKDYYLDIEQKDSVFAVTLRINLLSHVKN